VRLAPRRANAACPLVLACRPFQVFKTNLRLQKTALGTWKHDTAASKAQFCKTNYLGREKIIFVLTFPRDNFAYQTN
jgi:hypothetical protein